MKKFRLFLSCIMLAASLWWLWFSGSTLLLYREFSDFAYSKEAMTFFMCGGLVMVSMAAVCLLKIIKGEKQILRRLFFAELSLFSIMISIGQGLIDGDFEVFVCFLIIGFLFATPLLLWKYLPKGKVAKWEEAYESKFVFKSAKVKWSWDDAASEYCDKTCNTFDTLTDEDKDLIWTYAANCIGYFLAWLIKHNEYGFTNYSYDVGECDEMLDRISEEEDTPIGFLNGVVDGCIYAEDIRSENVRRFLYVYYDNTFLKGGDEKLTYFKDFRQVTGGYCHEFSWEKYHQLEILIDDRFKLFNAFEQSTYDEPVGELAWYSMDARLEATSSKFAPANYIEFARDYFFANESIIADNILKEIIKRGEELDIAPEYQTKEVVRFHSIAIYPNKKSKSDNGLWADELYDIKAGSAVPSFILSGECDWDEEHGVGVSVCGTEVMDIAGYGDLD